jgi:hypothetical protein
MSNTPPTPADELSAIVTLSSLTRAFKFSIPPPADHSESQHSH